MKKKGFKIIMLLLIALLITGAVSTPTYAAKGHKIKLSTAVQWVNHSDEYKLCVMQAYLNAINRLEKLAKNEKPGKWCVVLDADETVWSNIGFQKYLQAIGQEYSGKEWTNWCMKGEATLLPGAKEFCDKAKELGGKVIIVTNRKAPLYEPTAKNLKNIGIKYDALLLREGPYRKDRSKTMRRADVEKGKIQGVEAKKKLPPLKILMRAGDQKHDLYDKSKYKYDDIKDRVNLDFIIIPNPIYGSWQRHPESTVKSIGAPDNFPIKAKVGQEFLLKLNANRTTGYQWQLAKPLNKDIVTLVNTDYWIPKTPGLVGSGGKSVWRFKAIGKGKTLIHLKYVRPWEKKVKPEKTKTFIIIVK
ncbi:MAG: protease inhibitor I42 family protein [Candidatus Eremiobacteraeota bacterium]|nr:protease inhibitor I42 family protein [Candidatus Eremiobacteraeota bacterium]